MSTDTNTFLNSVFTHEDINIINYYERHDLHIIKNNIMANNLRRNIPRA